MVTRPDRHEDCLAKTKPVRIDQRHPARDQATLFQPLHPPPARIGRNVGTRGQRFERLGGIGLQGAQQDSIYIINFFFHLSIIPKILIALKQNNWIIAMNLGRTSEIT